MSGWSIRRTAPDTFGMQRDAFQKAHPEILLNVEAEDMKVLENSLADDVYDVIFIPDFERYSVQLPGYQWKYAAKAPVQVIVPVNHR